MLGFARRRGFEICNRPAGILVFAVLSVLVRRQYLSYTLSPNDDHAIATMSWRAILRRRAEQSRASAFHVYFVGLFRKLGGQVRARQ